MSPFLIVCCFLLAGASAAGQTKISLEDIEKDNLRSEKKPRAPPNLVKSPTQYGFVPVKTVDDYKQKGPKNQYVQAQYAVGQNSPYFQGPQKFQPQKPEGQQQYTVAQYAPQQYAVGQGSVDQTQQYYTTQYQTPTDQYQQYENVQYVTDNGIGQRAEQYYPQQQQYVYIQQYPSSSNSIQHVVDPKGQLQYIMYVPSYVAADQTQNYENVVYADQTQQVAQDASAEQYAVPVYAPEKQVQVEVQPQVHVQPELSALHYQGSNTRYVPPKEPKSLLDSYVPSILQLQYYKQQQKLANSIPYSHKVSQPIIGKTDYIKSSYRSPTSYSRLHRSKISN